MSDKEAPLFLENIKKPLGSDSFEVKCPECGRLTKINTKCFCGKKIQLKVLAIDE